jgi:hypothetical protein
MQVPPYDVRFAPRRLVSQCSRRAASCESLDVQLNFRVGKPLTPSCVSHTLANRGCSLSVGIPDEFVSRARWRLPPVFVQVRIRNFVQTPVLKPGWRSVRGEGEFYFLSDELGHLNGFRSKSSAFFKRISSCFLGYFCASHNTFFRFPHAARSGSSTTLEAGQTFSLGATKPSCARASRNY